MAAGAGCATNAPAEQSRLSENPPAIEILRGRADDLLKDIAMGDPARLRPYFAPGIEVDVREQLQLYLHAPAGRVRIVRWDGAQIAVTLSSDRRRGDTAVRAEVAEDGGPAVARVIEFRWTSSADGEPYYLVPLSPSR